MERLISKKTSIADLLDQENTHGATVPFPKSKREQKIEETEINTTPATVTPTLEAVRQSPIASGNLNYEAYMQKAVELFQDQMQMGENAGVVDIASLELSEAKANSFLNALNNIISVGHLTTLVEADDVKFTRKQEMEAMNPLLRSFATAANASERVVGYISRQMVHTVGELEELEEQGIRLENTAAYLTAQSLGKKGEVETNFISQVRSAGEKDPNLLLGHLGHLHTAFTSSVDNLVKIANGTEKIINLERNSGCRPMGNNRIGIPSSGGGGQLRRLGRPAAPALPVGGNTGGGVPGSQGSPREMGSEELLRLALAQREEEENDSRH